MLTKQESIKLVTLNVGRGLNKNHLKSIDFLAESDCEIACIQDMREDALPDLKKIFPAAQYFAPMCRHMYLAPSGVSVGVGIFSRTLPFRSLSTSAYVNNVLPVLNLEGVSNDGQHVDLQKIRETESRLLVVAEIEKNGVLFKIGTTHGIWVKGGVPDDHQRQGTQRLLSAITKEGDMVLAGDLNAARGGEIYSTLVKQLKDRVPAKVDNSLDPELHPLRGRLKLMVDYFFTAGAGYTVSDVNIIFGISDHGVLSGTISRAS